MHDLIRKRYMLEKDCEERCVIGLKREASQFRFNITISILSIMHVISLDSYFKILLYDTNFIFIENI